MIKKLLSKLNLDGFERGKAKRILALLSAITVFSTTYALILPAITIDRNAADNEPGLDVLNTDDNEKLVLSDSIPTDMTDYISRCASYSGLTVGAVLTDGMFDDNVNMDLTPISDENLLNAAIDAAEGFDREADKVRVVEISFKDENGSVPSPDAPLNLTLSGEAISEASDPVIVRIDNDGNAEEVDGKSFSNLVYLENEESSIYAVVETHEITTRYISADGSNYKIAVEYGPEAKIPKTAELKVSELDPNSKEYEDCFYEAYGKLPGGKVIKEARFFDISIMNEGKEIEPESEVSVKIAYEQPLELELGNEVMSIHFTDSGAELNSEVETADTKKGGSEVSFKQSSFSVTGTLVTAASDLHVGSTYLLVAENNGKYYAVGNNNADLPAQEVALTIDGSNVTFNKTAISKTCLWTYATTNNGVTLQNKNSNRYIVMSSSGYGYWSSVTMASMNSTPLTLSFANNGKASIAARYNNTNYYLVYNSNNNTFTRSNNSSTQFYFIEYSPGDENQYQIKFHYVDRDGNDIAPPEIKTMQYSTTAVDLHQQPYAKEIEGYDFRVSRYGAYNGDRFQYVLNDKNTSTGETIINLKTDTMYANSTSNQPHIYNFGNMDCVTDVVDSIDLTNRADHMIDVYMAYSEEGSPDPNQIIDQFDTPDTPDEEFPSGAPDHNKRLVPNSTNGKWDGTYTLYIDVTGKAATVNKKTKADIMLIYDTSNSMHDEADDGRRRYQIAYEVVSEAAKQLFANNSDVRIAMVSFASTAKKEFGYVDNLNAFNTGFDFADDDDTYVNGDYGGTNWEDALQTAYKVWKEEKHDEDAKQYVVFISDGEPTCRVSWCDWYDTRDACEYKMTNRNPGPNTDTHTGKQFYEHGYANLVQGHGYYYTGVEHAYTNAKDDARTFVNNGVNLYTVGIFNDEDSLWQMNTLANYAYSGFAYKNVKNKNYKYAANADVLDEVFADIIHEITMDFGYGNVSIMDAMTSTALTTGDLVGKAADFKYYKNPAGGTLTEWNGAPTATYNKDTKKIDWDLSSEGMLDENTTYTLSFTVWPNQDTYDAIIILNDMIDNEEDPDDVDAYAREHYPESLWKNLRKDDENHYIVQSNAEAELSYERFVKENGELKSLGTGKAGYSFPNMKTTNYYLTVSKLWNDSLQTSNRFQTVFFEVFEDYDDTPGATNEPYATVTLDASNKDPNDPYRWKKQIEISPGIIKTEINGNDPINEGHTYRVFEVGYEDTEGNYHDISTNYDDYRYEFSYEEVTPMLYDGYMVLLNDADGDGQLTGTNDLRGGINLYKVTLGRDGNRIYTDDEYEFIFHCTVPEKYLNDPKSYPLWYKMCTDVDMDGNYEGKNDIVGIPGVPGGYGTLADGDHVKIKSNQMIRIINVPIGTQYSFEEINVPNGWGFNNATIMSFSDATDMTDKTLVASQDGPNSQNKNLISYTTEANKGYDVTFYNRMTTYEVKLHKVDEDNNTVVIPNAVFEVYTAPGKKPADIVTVNNQTRFTTNENGDISLGQLPTGTYYLYEVTAPPGYRRLAEPIVVNVTLTSVTYSQAEYNSGETQTAPLTQGENSPVYTITAVNQSNGDLKIIKIDAEHPETTLEGAVFNLYALPEGANEDDLIDPSTGIIDPERLDLLTVAGETDLTSGEGGVILIEDGLDPGVYYLFEITSPDGYSKTRFPVKITVAADGEVTYVQRDYNAGQLMEAIPSTSGDGTLTVTVYVANSSGVQLPHTGGIGTILYTAGGLTLVCIAILTLCINLKRRRCERRIK